jgi:hypothetical protein
VAQFSAVLRDRADRERADQERQRLEREAAERAALEAAQHAEALAAARRELERSIERARSARRTGSGIATADEAWRLAKARVIELETGTPPAWAARGVDRPEPPVTEPEPEVETPTPVEP